MHRPGLHALRMKAIFLCVSGMVLILEVQVLYGPIGRNSQPKAQSRREAGWGTKPEATLGFAKQEPDRRPVRWVNLTFYPGVHKSGDAVTAA